MHMLPEQGEGRKGPFYTIRRWKLAKLCELASEDTLEVISGPGSEEGVSFKRLSQSDVSQGRDEPEEPQ